MPNRRTYQLPVPAISHIVTLLKLYRGILEVEGDYGIYIWCYALGMAYRRKFVEISFHGDLITLNFNLQSG